MLYVIVAISVLIAMIVFVVKRSDRGLLILFCCSVGAVICFVTAACNGYYYDLLYSDLSETDCVNVEYIYYEPQSYKLELLPESEDKYIERINNSFKYCIKNNDGEYLIKNTNSSLSYTVDIIYTDNKQPCCVVEGGEKITTLTKRPNIWLNLFQWLVVRDYDIGDIVKEYPLDDIYTFYIPYNK